MKGRRIFISYAHDDYSLIQSISASVKDANDLTWIDRNFIIAGDEWRGKIQKALKSSYCLIFFASTSSVKSKEVSLEIAYALKLRKRVIPVLLEKCDLPYEISNLHFVSLTKRNQQEIEVFRQIVSGISLKKRNKPAIVSSTAATIVQDIKSSNSLYNTVIVRNRFLWTATIASVVLFFFIAYWIIPVPATVSPPVSMPPTNIPKDEPSVMLDTSMSQPPIIDSIRSEDTSIK